MLQRREPSFSGDFNKDWSRPDKSRSREGMNVVRSGETLGAFVGCILRYASPCGGFEPFVRIRLATPTCTGFWYRFLPNRMLFLNSGGQPQRRGVIVHS